MKYRSPFQFLWSFLWPKDASFVRRRMVLCGVFLVLSKVTAALLPFCYKHAVDYFKHETLLTAGMPILLIVGYGLSRGVSVLFEECKKLLFASVEQRAVRQVCVRVFSYLHALSLRFHLNRKTGQVGRVIEKGSKAIENLLKFATFSILPTALEIMFVFIMVFYLYGFTLGVLMAFLIGGYVLYTIKVTHWRAQFVRKLSHDDNQKSSYAVESLLNYETVKYFTNERLEIERYDRVQRTYEASAIKNHQGLVLLNAGQGLFISLGMIAVMLYMGHGVVDGRFTVGDFVLINTYLMQLYHPLNILGFAYREIKHALIELEDVAAILQEPVEIRDAEDAVVVPDNPSIVLDNVSFYYEKKRPILHNISLRVPQGKKIAIVGSSGSGKSTLSRLLFRFYDVTGGSISIGGVDIRHITQESLRACMGVVPQDMVLFNESIYYNIAYGRPNATYDDVVEAAEMANLHDFVMSLPDGYDTTVGERGLKLSGGEKQRVAIARVLIKKPSIYVFDEATSSLDTHTEKVIQAQIDSIAEGHTAIMIAHRLSTVVNCDLIVVLDKGRIIEQGTHEELLAQQGVYDSMWQKQNKKKSS